MSRHAAGYYLGHEEAFKLSVISLVYSGSSFLLIPFQKLLPDDSVVLLSPPLTVSKFEVKALNPF